MYPHTNTYISIHLPISYTDMHTCIYKHKNTFIYTFTYIYMYKHIIHMGKHIFVNMYTQAHTCTHIDAYTYTCNLCVCVHVCNHIHI